MPLAEREAVVRARLLAPDGLTGQDATFGQAALTKAVYQAATGLLDVTEASGFLERFTGGSDLVPIASPEGPRFTTAVLLAKEQQITLQWMDVGVEAYRDPTKTPGERSVYDAVRVHFEMWGVNKDQADGLVETWKRR